jgi:type I restriction-modification system DNA methylase subunit
MLEAIERVLKKAKVKDDKFDAMMSNYSFIKANRAVKQYLRQTIGKLYRHLFFALLSNTSFDLLGSFYGEFLRYSGGDKQGLGIVLTPRHITELFADLADLNPNESVVLDICAGTGGYLIASMANMIGKSSGDSETISRIQNKGLIGIELDPQMFTLACANMILRGDGKANMFLDDSLNPKEQDAEKRIQELKPNVGMLNPPYSKKAKGKSELRFVQRSLELLQPNAIGIAIVPVPALIDDSKESIQIKKELLERHTLRAVMSMPPQLFPQIGAVTAIVVFTAHTPHLRTSKDSEGNVVQIPKLETWFGYWRDDGFVISKNKRIERRPGIWSQTKREWLDAYFNQRVVAGQSCKHAVSYTDEWVAEAYLETDYSQITRYDFERQVKKFVLYDLLREVQVTYMEGEDDET